MTIRESIRKMAAHRTLDSEYQALTPKVVHLFESYFRSSWWVLLFLLICYSAYSHSISKLNVEYGKLHDHYAELLREKKLALSLQADYLLQINSQSDPDWIELTLMKVLGLVPEEQVKVFFTESG
jgi:hypothetical protein